MLEEEILKGLLECNTVNPPGNERSAAVYLRNILESHGIRCQIQELGGGRANLIASVGTGGPEILLNGHLDVVPAPGKWEHDPFTLTKEKEKYYGRGVCDMKGAIASMCTAAIHLAQSQSIKNGRLRLFFTADEECSNLGTHAYLERYPASDFAVIGEPTNLKVAVAHRGVVRTNIEIQGEAMHAALLKEEDTAIDYAARAVLALKEFHRELQRDKHPILGPASLAVTKLQGYEKDNVIPERVCIRTDFRILPQMAPESIRGMIAERLRQVGILKNSVSDHFSMPGGELSPEDPFVRLCCREAGKVTGREERPTAFGASCEQCFFVQKGIRTVICGPGSLEQAHTTDEWLEAAQLRQASSIYEGIVKSILST